MKFLIVAGHEGTTGAVSGKLIEEVLTEQLSEKIVKILALLWDFLNPVSRINSKKISK